MSGRIRFTFNAMVLLPLLRSLPAAGATSIVTTLVAMAGLDFGVMGLGHPETAADDLVAWIMSFSVAAPAFWTWYMVTNAWNWLTGFMAHRRETRA